MYVGKIGNYNMKQKMRCWNTNSYTWQVSVEYADLSHCSASNQIIWNTYTKLEYNTNSSPVIY